MFHVHYMNDLEKDTMYQVAILTITTLEMVEL